MTAPTVLGGSASAPDRLAATVQAAVDQGLLPPGTGVPVVEPRPWPLVLLGGLGAWLAAGPLLLVVGMLFGGLLAHGAGRLLVGVLVVAGTLVVLRSRGVAVFVEQLALALLLSGGSALAIGLTDLFGQRPGLALAALAALLVGALVPQAWLRVLAGAAALPAAALALAPTHRLLAGATAHAAIGLALQACLLAWLAAWAWRRSRWPTAAARPVAALDALAAGWALALLAALALWSGMSFLVGASLGAGAPGDLMRDAAGSASRWGAPGLLALLSAALAAAAATLLARAWPGLRRPWLAGAAAVGIGLALVMPALGAVLLVAAACVMEHRWRLAAAAGLAAAWIVGAFYYRLDWTLDHKALVLIGAGALLALLARVGGPWRAARHPAPAAAAMPLPARPPAWRPLLLAGAATLALVNGGIARNESLIAEGEPLFVELAPVDPRSLMQGDYMQLDYRMPPELRGQLDGVAGHARPRVVLRRDARGVASVLRRHDGGTLAADERLLETSPSNGRWTLVTDSWTFREGEAARWSRARYAEFRVRPGGQALLVGLRGAGLEPL